MWCYAGGRNSVERTPVIILLTSGGFIPFGAGTSWRVSEFLTKGIVSWIVESFIIMGEKSGDSYPPCCWYHSLSFKKDSLLPAKCFCMLWILKLNCQVNAECQLKNNREAETHSTCVWKCAVIFPQNLSCEGMKLFCHALIGVCCLSLLLLSSVGNGPLMSVTELLLLPS